MQCINRHRVRDRSHWTKANSKANRVCLFMGDVGAQGGGFHPMMLPYPSPIHWKDQAGKKSIIWVGRELRTTTVGEMARTGRLSCFLMAASLLCKYKEILEVLYIYNVYGFFFVAVNRPLKSSHCGKTKEITNSLIVHSYNGKANSLNVNRPLAMSHVPFIHSALGSEEVLFSERNKRFGQTSFRLW